MCGEGAAGPRRLADLVPAGVFVGTSLILRRGDRFLYGVRAPHAKGARQIIELTGIGGVLEDEDDSLTAGALREAREETGCTVRVLPARDTIVVRGEHDIERVLLTGDERPAAVVFRRYRTPPHQPWHEDHEGEAWLVVFWAEIDGQPWPAMELPALMWLKSGQVVETARQDVPLSRLLDSGAELIESAPGLVPRTTWARLTDSQEALVLALADKAPLFYEAMTVE
jgi:8-oxo-dGTP pyrophosphatase MutT (NUDIX family)